MAASKSSLSTGFSSTSVSAGATTNGTAMDLTTAYGATVTIQIVTTTAPTSAGVVTIAIAATTGGTFVPYLQTIIPMVASSTLYYSFDIPSTVGAVEIQITAGTGTGITVTAQCEALTGI